MFASKATAAKVSLKVTFKDDIPAGGLMFTFTSSQAGEDRTSVQDTLIPYITANRSAPNGVVPPAAAATPTSTSAAAVAVASANGTPTESGSKKRKAFDPSTPTDTAPGTPSGPSGAGGGGGGKGVQTAAKKIQLRVLRKNPNLKLLYIELVVGKEITEEEFWDGREVSYTGQIREDQLTNRHCFKLRQWRMSRNQGEHLDYLMIDLISIQAGKGKWQLEVQE
jgi:transcription initiation factor TFIIH subunit 1